MSGSRFNGKENGELPLCGCPFRDDTSSIRELVHGQRALTANLEKAGTMLRQHEQYLASMPEISLRMAELRGTIERLGGALVRAFLFIGLAVLGVVLALVLLIVIDHNIEIASSPLKLKSSQRQ